MAMFGFFQGSLNSGDWAKLNENEQTTASPTSVSLVITSNIMPELKDGAVARPTAAFVNFGYGRDTCVI